MSIPDFPSLMQSTLLQNSSSIVHQIDPQLGLSNTRYSSSYDLEYLPLWIPQDDLGPAEPNQRHPNDDSTWPAAYLVSSHRPARDLSPSVSHHDLKPTGIDYVYLYQGSLPLMTQYPPLQRFLTHQPSNPFNQSPQRLRDRPRCFEHGCGGRTFSCQENYKRHLRERNRLGSVICPICGIPFSRRSNQEKHIVGGKCKKRTMRNPCNVGVVSLNTSLSSTLP